MDEKKDNDEFNDVKIFKIRRKKIEKLKPLPHIPLQVDPGQLWTDFPPSWGGSLFKNLKYIEKNYTCCSPPSWGEFLFQNLKCIEKITPVVVGQAPMAPAQASPSSPDIRLCLVKSSPNIIRLFLIKLYADIIRFFSQ